MGGGKTQQKQVLSFVMKNKIEVPTVTCNYFVRFNVCNQMYVIKT